MMALFNPVYAMAVIFLFIFTVPFALCAAFTTTLACCVLAFRVMVVYAELFLAVVPYLGGKAGNFPPVKSPLAPARQRRRRSTSSGMSAGSITPGAADLAMGLHQSAGPPRDYEGVGGWRMNDGASDDEDLWTKINSRLELPADHVRRHQRSHTGGTTPLPQSRSYSPEATMNTSRTRTGGASGFPQNTGTSPRQLKKTISNSSSASSCSSSKGSGVLMKQRC